MNNEWEHFTKQCPATPKLVNEYLIGLQQALVEAFEPLGVVAVARQLLKTYQITIQIEDIQLEYDILNNRQLMEITQNPDVFAEQVYHQIAIASEGRINIYDRKAVETE